MGSISKRGASWRAEIMRRGVRESKSFTHRQLAVDWLAEREAGVIAVVGDSSRRSLVAAIDRYESHLAAQGKDDHAVVLRLAWLRRQDWAQRPVRDLTSETLSEWRNGRLQATSARGAPIKPGTVLREMTLMRAVLEYARKDLGWIDKNPLRDVSRPAKPPARRRPISDAERDGIVKALGYTGAIETIAHEVAVAFLLALETAMRAGEIVGLEWVRVDTQKRVARLDKTKNGDQREVPLSNRAVELIEAMRARKLLNIRRPVSKTHVFHIDSASLDTTFRRARVAVCDPDSSVTITIRWPTNWGPCHVARVSPGGLASADAHSLRSAKPRQQSRQSVAISTSPNLVG